MSTDFWCTLASNSKSVVIDYAKSLLNISQTLFELGKSRRHRHFLHYSKNGVNKPLTRGNMKLIQWAKISQQFCLKPINWTGAKITCKKLTTNLIRLITSTKLFCLHFFSNIYIFLHSFTCVTDDNYESDVWIPKNQLYRMTEIMLLSKDLQSFSIIVINVRIIEQFCQHFLMYRWCRSLKNVPRRVNRIENNRTLL